MFISFECGKENPSIASRKKCKVKAIFFVQEKNQNCHCTCQCIFVLHEVKSERKKECELSFLSQASFTPSESCAVCVRECVSADKSTFLV